MRRAAPHLLTLLAVVALSVAGQERTGPGALSELMTRVGDRIEQYYARARSIVCEETVRLQPLGSDLLSDGSHVRELLYELRVAWEAPPEGATPPDATVLRHLVAVDGRPPRAGDEPGCLDPRPVSTEPLAMLLSSRQHDFAFTVRETGQTGGRPSVTLDYKSSTPRAPDVTWKGECVSIELPGRTRGRLWVDRATADVLRLDEQLTGPVDIRVPKARMRYGSAASLIVERADSSIRYRLVTFHDPEEMVMLPESVDSVQVVRNTGVPRLRIVQKFSKYRRFITDARIVQ